MNSFFSRLRSFIRGEQNLEKLKRRGLIVGKNFTRMSGVILDPSHCWHISIGDNVVLAPRVHILAHDASTKVFLNYTRVADTRIGNNVFVGSQSVLANAVTIGDNIVVGAGSFVRKSISEKGIYSGNPAILKVKAK